MKYAGGFITHMLPGDFQGVVLGDINVDMYGEFPGLPQKGQGMNTDNLEIGLGGAGMNLTQMLTALGCKSYPLANLGTGSLSEIAKTRIEKLAIEKKGIARISGKSGLFFCIITPDGDRTMFGYRGVNRSPVDYSQRLKQLPPPAEWDFIFISAYLFLYSQQRKKLLAWLKKLSGSLPKIKVGAVVSHLFAERAGAGEIDIELLNCCDCLFMNKAEFEQIAGRLSPNNMRELAGNLELKTLAVTEGETGCVIYSRDYRSDIIKTEGFDIEPVDTTGAGDCFAAGLMGAKIAGFSPRKAALLGNFCGAAAGLGYGVSKPVKRLQEIEVENKEQLIINRTFLQNMLQEMAEQGQEVT